MGNAIDLHARSSRNYQFTSNFWVGSSQFERRRRTSCWRRKPPKRTLKKFQDGGWLSIHQPQDHAQHHTDDERGHQRKIEGEARPLATHTTSGLFQGPCYRTVITSPLRSAATISPTWRPDTVSNAPFWLVSRIAPR